MLHATLKKRKIRMDLNILILVITLLNLGLVTLALSRINGLRKDLRTPVVKKFNQDFKRKSVDIPKAPENFGKNQRDDKPGRPGNQPFGQNRPRNGAQQNRPAPVRRPAAKAPDVYSNEAPMPQASTPVPPRPVSAETSPAAEGRRPLPPRFNGNPDPAPSAPAAVSFAQSDSNDNDSDSGMEFDRSKMAHGRRNVVAKPVIEDDAEANA
ncbi:MAG: hypothetical protein FWB90_03260 [Fibromonadales bacterium]|nr:hypothetical protein [Fibromonadales bacterium]